MGGQDGDGAARETRQAKLVESSRSHLVGLRRLLLASQGAEGASRASQHPAVGVECCNIENPRALHGMDNQWRFSRYSAEVGN